MVFRILKNIHSCLKESFPKESRLGDLFLKKSPTRFIGNESNHGIQEKKRLKQPGEMSREQCAPASLLQCSAGLHFPCSERRF